MVPRRVAEFLAVTQETTEGTEHFKPKERFTVCLCADWRNFQKLASSLPNEKISELLEGFYDQALSMLERLVPSENYYFHWTADELFVVFFAEAGPPSEVLRDALKFSHALATETFLWSQDGSLPEIRFDIGLAAGIGLLGLQGPKLMKKTTISGEVAGRSKRFQNEAKRMRRSLGEDSPPILVVDEQLYAATKETDLFDSAEFHPIRAQTKDITNLVCYYWSSRSSTAVKTQVS